MKSPQTEPIAKLRLGASPSVKQQAPLATSLAHHDGEIDAFYAQFKRELGGGWLLEPEIAEMREREAG